MKKYIKSSKYIDRAERDLKSIGLYGQALAKVAEANTPEEIQEAASLVFGGSVLKRLQDKQSAIEAIAYNLDYAVSEYLSNANAEKKKPEVVSTIVAYLKGLGYNVTKMQTPPRGADESYVIIPADECAFEDLETVASEVSTTFGLKPDTGVIGGSWTSYQFNKDGVSFRIGFEEDKDFDPSGKESSLQLYL